VEWLVIVCRIAYWNIGREIVEEEQKGEDRATYGKEIIKQLSVKLSSQDKNMSERNLWYMRQFYGLWPNLNVCRLPFFSTVQK